MQFSQKIEILTGLLELIQLYKQNPLEKFFIFTIYRNYTLALNNVFKLLTRLEHLSWMRGSVLRPCCLWSRLPDLRQPHEAIIAMVLILSE